MKLRSKKWARVNQVKVERRLGLSLPGRGTDIVQTLEQRAHIGTVGGNADKETVRNETREMLKSGWCRA